jgi:20S proteasome alpha/beta subunit
LGILSTEGIVLAAEKKIISKLLDNDKKAEKMYRLDDHLCCSVAGITSDANILINYARLYAQRYMYAYQESVPVENLVKDICDMKQGKENEKLTNSRLYTIRRNETIWSFLTLCRMGQIPWFPTLPL